MNDKPVNDNPTIPDDMVFACQDAAAEEMSRWMTYELTPATRGVLCIRNRMSPGDVDRQTKQASIEVRGPAPEEICLKDMSYAKSFVGWRGVKAALEYYESIRKEPDNEQSTPSIQE